MTSFARWITVAVLSVALADSAAAQQVRAIRDYKNLPLLTYDEDGDPADFTIDEGNAPPAQNIVVWGWRPDMKMLLVQLDPGDPDTVFINFYGVAMVDQAGWDRLMQATGQLVCAGSSAGRQMHAGNPSQNTAGLKGFKNPC
jgi:hypothetical protein